MWIKVCANTSLDDALCALGLGADAVGFVFAPSSRQVTPEQVRAITSALPPQSERVGVFPAWPAAQIAEAAQHAGLTAIQLHGGFDPDRTRALRVLLPQKIGLIEVAHWTVGEDQASFQKVTTALEQIAAQSSRETPRDVSDRILIDAKVHAASGGTGVPFNWERARPAFSRASGLRLILAGGLRPENVAEAIQTVRPWGIDVASGVEAMPGKKDPGRLRSFLERARAARPEQ